MESLDWIDTVFSGIFLLVLPFMAVKSCRKKVDMKRPRLDVGEEEVDTYCIVSIYVITATQFFIFAVLLMVAITLLQVYIFVAYKDDEETRNRGLLASGGFSHLLPVHLFLQALFLIGIVEEVAIGFMVFA